MRTFPKIMKVIHTVTGTGRRGQVAVPRLCPTSCSETKRPTSLKWAFPPAACVRSRGSWRTWPITTPLLRPYMPTMHRLIQDMNGKRSCCSSSNTLIFILNRPGSTFNNPISSRSYSSAAAFKVCLTMFQRF